MGTLSREDIEKFMYGAKTPTTQLETLRSRTPPPVRESPRSSRDTSQALAAVTAPSPVRHRASSPAATPKRVRAASPGLTSVLTPRKVSLPSPKRSPLQTQTPNVRKRPASAIAQDVSAIVPVAVSSGPLRVRMPKKTRLITKVVKPLARPRSDRTNPFNASAMTKVQLPDPPCRDPRRRPQRCRIPRLEHWRGERKILVKGEGDAAPRLAGVELNLAPRPFNTPERPIGSKEQDSIQTSVLHVPRVLPPSATKSSAVTSLTFGSFQSKVISIGPKGSYIVPSGVVGFAIVLEGSARLGCEDGAEVTLDCGSCAALPPDVVPDGTDTIIAGASPTEPVRVKLCTRVAAKTQSRILALEDQVALEV